MLVDRIAHSSSLPSEAREEGMMKIQAIGEEVAHEDDINGVNSNSRVINSRTPGSARRKSVTIIIVGV